MITMCYEDGGFHSTAVYGHFITGRTSFIQWMFSKEGLGEQLKVHKREKFFDSDFELFTIL
jgi:hypothetical protein